MSGHSKGRVKSIPKADREIGKCVSQIVLKMSGHFSFLNAVIPERFSRCHVFFPLCGSNCRCRVPKEMSGHGKCRVKSIPKADRGIGKCVSQIVLKMSGKSVQSGFGKWATYHCEQNYA